MESHESQKRDEELIQFIAKLTDPSIDIEENYTELIEKLESIYLDAEKKGVYRHSYARISHYFYEREMDGEGISLCLENLFALKEHVDQHGNPDLSNAFRKLIDHIDLESIHLGQIRKIRMSVSGMDDIIKQYPEISAKIDQVENQTERVDEESKKALVNIEGIRKEMKEQTVQSISILGIFAGVVFAFSGGFSMLSNTLSNLHQISGAQTLFFFASSISIGCVLYDVIFALLMFIGRYCEKEPRGIADFTKWLNKGVAVIVFLLMVIYCLCCEGIIYIKL